MLLGQTLDSMRVWDIRKSLQVIRSRDRNCSIIIRADGVMAANALYAAILEPPVAALTLSRLPRTHAEAPDYLNVLRVLDLPQAVAMAAARSKVRLVGADPKDWEFARAAITRLKWPESQLRFD
jgi:hypothetical protein